MNSLETEVLQNIGEDTNNPDVFSDITQIRDSINDAIEEISMLTGAYNEKYTIPLYAGQGIYKVEFSRGLFAFPIDVFLRNENRRLDQTDFVKLKMEDPRWLRDSGIPYEYFMIGMDFIGVHPFPSGTGSILDINCAVIPDRYTQDNDRIKLRNDFKKAVIHYAVGEYYASRGDANTALQHMAIYFSRLNLNRSYQQSTDTTRYFTRESIRPNNPD
jgi:hypothetical protein